MTTHLADVCQFILHSAKVLRADEVVKVQINLMDSF